VTIAAPAETSGERPVEYCLITAGYPRRDGTNRSGWGTYAEMVVRCMRDAGVRVTIVLLEDDERLNPPDAFADPTIIRVPLRFVPYLSAVAPGLVEGLRLLRVIRGLDREHRFDVIEGPNVNGICWAVAASYRSRFVLRAHTALRSSAPRPGKLARWRASFRAWLDGATARCARHVITHSIAHAHTVVAEYDVPEERVVVIPHAVADPGPRPAGNPERLLSIANAAHRKGVDVLLRAFAAIRTRHPAVTLVAVGCTAADACRLLGVDAGDTVALAGIITPGQLSDADLEMEWDQAGIVVVPSRYESFGLVAAEAMARGKVVIATDGGALGEVVGSGGVIVPAGDSESLRAAIEDVLGSRERRDALSAAARVRYAALFAPTRLAQRLVQFITSQRRR
jgi:glycosyltransferase involved in cell wall biosynthesis